MVWTGASTPHMVLKPPTLDYKVPHFRGLLTPVGLGCICKWRTVFMVFCFALLTGYRLDPVFGTGLALYHHIGARDQANGQSHV